jgi:sugar lactone lactonase YvrE
MEPIDTIRVGNTLGEGVLWDADSQTLWWTDIHDRKLYRHDYRARRTEAIAMPERLCSFGFVRDSGNLIAAFESGLAFYDPSSGATEWVARPPARAGVRFNDGRIDRQGRFWAGTMVEAEGLDEKASLYCLEGSGKLQIRESGIAISNGICWSPDGKRFYFADSPLQTIFAYDFDATSGAISNKRVFAKTPPGAYPDGANVDAEGFLWSAHWGAGQVVRYAPDGTIDRTIDVPASQPTCIAFGGPDLDLLFVTSARDGLTADALLRHPSAGDVFIYRVGIRGLPDARFAWSGDQL